MSIQSCPKYKCCHNTIQHIGAGMVTDDFLSLCLQCCTEHVVGRSLAIGTAYYKNVFFDFPCQFFQYGRIYLKCDLTCPCHTLASHLLAGKASCLGSPDCQYSSNIHVFCSFYFNFIVPTDFTTIFLI